MKRLLSIITLSFCLLFTAQAVSAQAKSATSKKTVFTVENLGCDSEMPVIRKRLLNSDGIESVTFTKRLAGTSDVTVHYMESVIKLEEIFKVIESTPGCDDKSTTPYRIKQKKVTKSKA